MMSDLFMKGKQIGLRPKASIVIRDRLSNLEGIHCTILTSRFIKAELLLNGVTCQCRTLKELAVVLSYVSLWQWLLLKCR